jgi:hypothetical protein
MKSLMNLRYSPSGGGRGLFFFFILGFESYCTCLSFLRYLTCLLGLQDI